MMPEPSFALIHGGSMNARYWDLVVPLLDHPALAVDLPGRASRPADINEITIADWVESAVRDIEEAGLQDIVLVGNSLAGITMPGVAARLPRRIRHLVFSSCTVPSHGRRTVEFLRPDIQKVVLALEEPVATGKLRFDASMEGGDTLLNPVDAIGEDAPEECVRFLEDPLRRQFPEAIGVFYETFSWDGFPSELPRTYIKNLRDRMVPADLQDVMIRNMGGARVIELDAPHCPAIRHPERIAALLNEISGSIQKNRDSSAAEGRLA